MLQLGIVTDNIAKDWNLPTILSRFEKLGYAGVELRTSHAHKVEAELTPDQRSAIRKRFEDSPVELAGLRTTFEFQATDPVVVRKNIEGTKESVRLAHDIGSPGVTVRPNGVPKGTEREATLERIGKALNEVGEDAAGFGVEVQGGITQELPNFAKILTHADHPNVYACWNSNPTDVVDGSVRSHFALVGPRIHEVHLRDLTDESYPWRELFALLDAQGFDGYTLAEIPESSDPERVLRYFRALWQAYQPRAQSG